MRRLVVGDIHGGYKALTQVLARCDFDSQEDMLITLGDLCDGWSESFEVIDYLIKLPHWKGVRGNHDQWLKNWMFKHDKSEHWLTQGGAATVHSYRLHLCGIGEYAKEWKFPIRHMQFLKDMPMYLNLDGKLFVHGGFNPKFMAEIQGNDVLMWDRTLMNLAYREHRLTQYRQMEPVKYGVYDEIYLGHTTVTNYGLTEPARFGNIIGMDTGGGWDGKLSVMDIDTGEYWQSDRVSSLYPGEEGRRRR